VEDEMEMVEIEDITIVVAIGYTFSNLVG